MATPHVSALAAMLMQQGIRNPAALEAAIKQFARDLGRAGVDNEYGHGLIQPRQRCAASAWPGSQCCGPSSLPLPCSVRRLPTRRARTQRQPSRWLPPRRRNRNPRPRRRRSARTRRRQSQPRRPQAGHDTKAGRDSEAGPCAHAAVDSAARFRDLRQLRPFKREESFDAILGTTQRRSSAAAGRSCCRASTPKYRASRFRREGERVFVGPGQKSFRSAFRSKSPSRRSRSPAAGVIGTVRAATSNAAGRQACPPPLPSRDVCPTGAVRRWRIQPVQIHGVLRLRGAGRKTSTNGSTAFTSSAAPNIA